MVHKTSTSMGHEHERDPDPVQQQENRNREKEGQGERRGDGPALDEGDPASLGYLYASIVAQVSCLSASTLLFVVCTLSSCNVHEAVLLRNASLEEKRVMGCIACALRRAYEPTLRTRWEDRPAKRIPVLCSVLCAACCVLRAPFPSLCAPYDTMTQ